MRYHLVTLGCPKNVTDSERLTRALGQAGHTATDVLDAADVIILNTCGFIDQAKVESQETGRALAQQKAAGQRLFIVGCWSQIDPEAGAQIPEADAIFGVEAWDDIVRALGPAAPPDIPETGPVDPAARRARPSAYLKISDGCARPCTFCNIPAIKGRDFRSTSLDDLVVEARRLADEGVRELILVAQDSTAYGEDLGMGDGLALLLERLAVAVPEVPWLRLMYAYPGFVTPRLVETMAALPQVCHYLDIPLQHGSPAVLKRMKRPHNLRMVHDTLDRLRTAMPDIAIRTTFLVGFPGETQKEFQELLQFVREARFDRIGGFTYSPQAGTPSAAMPDHVPEPVKAHRLQQLMRVQQRISASINKQLVGRELPVLVESLEGQTSEDGTPVFVGRSYRDAPEVDGLVFCHGVARPGTMPRVRITAAMDHDLVGEPIDADTFMLISDPSR